MIKVGLSLDEIEYLSKEGPKNARKCSRRDLAYVMSMKGNGSTTVAGTMILANWAGIKVFVTGGIGGVHRGAESTMDISADLKELGQTPVAVISAGVKSILDIPKTLEYLETQGVPVVSFGQDEFPDFFTTDSGEKAPFRCDTPAQCAAMLKSQLQMNLETGMLFSVPIPADKAADQKTIRAGIDQALKEADSQNIQGAKITPFLLKRINELTGGESSASNVELILNNAMLGAQIAVEFAKQMGGKKYEHKVESEVEDELVKPAPSSGKASHITVVGGCAVDIISRADVGEGLNS